MLIVEATAPGKTILFGEHAVVYGKAAIAASIGLRTRAVYQAQSGKSVKLELKLLDFDVMWDIDTLKSLKDNNDSDEITPPDQDYLKRISDFITRTNSLPEGSTDFQKLALTIFLFLYTSIGQKYCNGFSESCAILVESELSVGAGMGSSASFSVCLSAILIAASGKIKELSEASKEIISDWAFCAETICHGSPSGIDNSICTFGGALLFQGGKMQSLLSSIPPLKVLLVDTGVPRNAKKLVTSVKARFLEHPEAMTLTIDAIDAIARESWALLLKISKSTAQDSHIASLQELVDMNQHLLNCLGVGHPKLDLICSMAQKHGCSAKLTGAGGGGCAIILSPSGTDTGALKDELKSSGFQYWDVIFGGIGLEINFKDM